MTVYQDPEAFCAPLAGAPAPAPALRVGLIGLGHVGLGTYRVLQRNQAAIAARAGRPVVITQVAVRRRERAAPLLAPEVRLVEVADLLRDPDIDVVVEAVGGTTLARDWVLQAIAQGKSVVTANKALLALHGDEIFAAAAARGVSVAFEGAVAVSIPIIKALRESLSANRIDWLAGIINGTSNFILSEMRDTGQDFDAVLREAQRLGYAEADPAFDVDGIDAAHKLSLLSALAFGTPLQFEQVAVQGIRDLQAQDVRQAEALGYRIKLLGVAQSLGPEANAPLSLRVQPVLLPRRHPLASVEGALNGILVHGDASGVVAYGGAGAGGEPTGAAVIADLVDLARQPPGPAAGLRVPHLAFHPEALRPRPVQALSASVAACYLRWPVQSAQAGLRLLSERLAAHGVPVRRLQPQAAAASGSGGQATPESASAWVLLGGPAPESVWQALTAELAASPWSAAPPVRLRIETLGLAGHDDGLSA